MLCFEEYLKIEDNVHIMKLSFVCLNILMLNFCILNCEGNEHVWHQGLKQNLKKYARRLQVSPIILLELDRQRKSISEQK